jgi:hypothetical protein
MLVNHEWSFYLDLLGYIHRERGKGNNSCCHPRLLVVPWLIPVAISEYHGKHEEHRLRNTGVVAL